MSGQSLAAAPDTRIGKTVSERYRIVRKLGEGGMGAVYEGEHLLLQRKVAIKALHTQFSTNAEMVGRFQREAMAANAIRHPNIVEVTDMGRFEDGAVFMVLEFLEGCDLGTVIARERALPLSRTVHILSQVCDALSAAQAVNIIHRDLKPENIYVTRRGEDPDFAKVLDFGIAKFAEGAGRGITRTGTTVGTPYYMSPEQAFGDADIDSRADIYSLGVVLFQCITGTLPFNDDSFPRLLMKVVEQPAPRLSSLSPNVPPELDTLVDRMLAKDRALRPQTFGEVKAALAPFREVSAAFRASLTPSAPPRVSAISGFAPTMTPEPAAAPSQVRPVVSAPKTERSEPPKRSSLAIWLVLGAGLLLFGGVGIAVVGYFALAREDVPQEAATENTVPAVSTPTPSPPPPVPAVPAEQVRVQVRTEPPEAALFLDGASAPNPLDRQFPRGPSVHRVEARLEGYRTDTVEFTPTESRELVLRLTRETNVAADDTQHHSSGRRREQAIQPVIRPLAPSTSGSSRPVYSPRVSQDEI